MKSSSRRHSYRRHDHSRTRHRTRLDQRETRTVEKSLVSSLINSSAMKLEKSSSTLLLFSFALSNEVSELNHLILACILEDNTIKIRSHTMIDSDVTDFAFVDEDFARCQNFLLYRLKTSRDVEVIDERSLELEPITHMIKIELVIDHHKKIISTFVTKLEHYSLMLELS